MLTETLSYVVFNLGNLNRIPLGEGREYQIGDEEIVIFRARDGVVYALQARCPHREGHLADGITGDGKIVCPMHSYKFELATGAPVGNDCQALKTYPVRISQAGEILLEWPSVTK
ncbi:MAG: Rieske 2Fe-2S domain-containing protein [Blastocatellia bacterium]|nr:Rieske 2Fe-2S domain-containing protein [Blastocatellia bacterium]